jgi:transcriptional regulator with XRE-family HTH domain
VPKIGHYQAICTEIIRLLREERKKRNLSNYAVAQRSGVSESMLSLVDRGLRNPSMELMLKVADGTGTDLAALVKKAQATLSRKERKAA